MERKTRNIHPGVILKDLVLDEKGISIGYAAKLLGLTGTMLSDITSGKIDVSVDISLRIAAVFGGTDGIWQRLQFSYGVEEAQIRIARLKLKRHKPKIKKAVLVKATKSINQTTKKAA